MRRHKRFRHGPPLFRGWIWMILIAFMLFGGKGNWWPGILIVIGLYFLFGSLFRDARPAEPPPHHDPPPFDAPPFDELRTAPPPAPRPAPPPVERTYRSELLPATCPNCGAPVRPNEVKWTSPHSAACSYCGSNLQAKK